MTSLDSTFALLDEPVTSAPYSNVVVSQDGKLQYIAHGAFVQVENEITRKLPTFALSTAVYQILQNLGINSVKLQGMQLIIQTNASTVQLPIWPDGVSYYKDVDEIVLHPLLTNTSVLELPKKDWNALTRDHFWLHYDSPEREQATKIVRLSFTPQSVTAESVREGVYVKSQILFIEAKDIKPFDTTVVLNSVIWNFWDFDTEETDEGPVKLSYGEGRSPLMIEHEAGVTVIASQVTV